MTGRVAHGKALPAEVVEQIVAKTDGVPLFVEELTKMVLESGLLQEREERYELTGPLPPLAIPATLHDSLMARLDRLATVKGLAQLGATLGREFSYDAAAGRRPVGRGDLAAGAAPVGGGGVPVPAGAAAAGDVPLQACPDPGRGLSVVAARAPASSTISALPRCWRRSFPRSSRPSPSCWPITTPRRARASRRFPTGSGRASAPASARPIWKRSATSPQGWSCSRPCQRRPSVPSRSLTCRSPSARHCDGHQGLCSPGGGAGLRPGTRVVSAGGRDAAALPGPVGLVAVLSEPGGSCRRRGSSGNSSCAWRSVPHDPALLPGGPLCARGRPCSAWASCRCPHAPGARHRPLRPQTAPCPGVPLWARILGVRCLSLCRADPLVAGVSGRKPWQRSPRGPGLGPGAGASL